DHEFYIGGYPGITVVQTVIHADDDNPLRLSELDSRLRNAVPSADVYACAFNEKEGWAGFAHWHEGEEKRVFSGTRYELMEDSGLPLPFENPYWAGEMAKQLGGIALPFEPRDLMEEAQRHWMGVSIDSEGPDLQVVGYAVDGRPEPKVDTAASVKSVQQMTSDAAFKLGMGPSNADYDDYESPDEEPTTATSETVQHAVETTTDFARKAARRAGSFLRDTTDKARDYIAKRRDHKSAPVLALVQWALVQRALLERTLRCIKGNGCRSSDVEGVCAFCHGKPGADMCCAHGVFGESRSFCPEPECHFVMTCQGLGEMR